MLLASPLLSVTVYVVVVQDWQATALAGPHDINATAKHGREVPNALAKTRWVAPMKAYEWGAFPGGELGESCDQETSSTAQYNGEHSNPRLSYL